MPKVTYIEHNGTQHEVSLADGESVMEGAINNGVDGSIGECGGGLACATCHCYVDEAWMDSAGERSETEDDMLDAASSARQPNSRLSCQIVMNADLDGLVVRLPESQY